MARHGGFYCVRNAAGLYLALAPRDAPSYTEFAESVGRALKFKTEEEVRDWCFINDIRCGNIWHRQH